MDNPKCRVCGAAMKRNGKTEAGAQRWRCKACGASMTHRMDGSAKQLKSFSGWLMGKRSLTEQSCSKATFERRAERFWKLWPLPSCTGEIHDVLFVDGIYVSKKLVVLIACTKEHVVSWHLAESECSESWAALMVKVAPPVMVVTDGGSGFRKAARAIWPNTKVQRCLVHVKRQVARKTAMHPKLECGRELLRIARALPKVKDCDAAAQWMADYAGWRTGWERFLREFTLKEGRKQYVHERLRSARRSLNGLARDETLFTFVEMQEVHGDTRDSTNNVVEGGVNARIRLMLQHHRGLTTIRRAKAAFWRCCLHSEFKASEAEMLRTMKTDEEVDGLFSMASGRNAHDGGSPEEYGRAIPEWSEMKMSGSKGSGWF